MKIEKIGEAGYEQAVLGFSLSYNTSVQRAMQLLPHYAHGNPGETKFLESIIVWLDVTAPRYWWQEADTYRVGTSKQSESTMHTITKRALTQADFEDAIPDRWLEFLNGVIADKDFYHVKAILPESFLQRRVWMLNYKTLQNIHIQRHNHRLPQWHIFLEAVLDDVEHPEFLTREEA